jgi:hypothetical protein
MAGASRADGLSRARTRRGSAKSYTMRPAALAAVQATRDKVHEMGNRRRRHTPAHWCRRRALSPFHRLVQSFPVGNVDHRAATSERWQIGNLCPFARRPQQQAQRRLDQFGHGAALACRFPLEFCHDGIIYIECRLHMGSHTRNMAIWQCGSSVLNGRSGPARDCAIRCRARRREHDAGGERETLHDRPIGDRAIKKKPRRSGAVTGGLFGRYDVLHRRFFGFGLLAVFIGILQ